MKSTLENSFWRHDGFIFDSQEKQKQEEGRQLDDSCPSRFLRLKPIEAQICHTLAQIQLQFAP